MSEYVAFDILPMAEVYYNIQKLRNALPSLDDMLIHTSREFLVGIIEITPESSEFPNQTKARVDTQLEPLLNTSELRVDSNVCHYIKKTLEILFAKHVTHDENPVVREIHKHFDNVEDPDYQYEIKTYADYKCYRISSEVADILFEFINRRNVAFRDLYTFVTETLDEYILNNVDVLSKVDFIVGMKQLLAQLEELSLNVEQFNVAFDHVDYMYTIVDNKEDDEVRTIISPANVYINLTDCVCLRYTPVYRDHGLNTFKTNETYVLTKFIENIENIIREFCKSEHERSMEAYVRKDLYDANADLFEIIRNDKVLGTKRRTDPPELRQALYTIFDYHIHFLEPQSDSDDDDYYY